MLNQLSGWPVLSSTCSHKPAAVGSLTAGAAQAAAFRKMKAATMQRRFILTSRISRRACVSILCGPDCGGLVERSIGKGRRWKRRAEACEVGVVDISYVMPALVAGIHVLLPAF